MKKKRKLSKKQQIRFAKMLAKKYEIPTDILDFESIIDETLSWQENKGIISSYVKALSNSIKKEEENYDKGEEEYLELQANLQEQEYVREQFEKAIEETMKIKTPQLDKYFHTPKELIKITVKGNNNFLVLKGSGGLGKTFCVLKTLAELGLTKPQIDYVYCSSHITPLELYHLLHSNQDKIIFLDDVENLLNLRVNIGILKGATWESAKGLRIVNYYSSTEKLKAPMSFTFSGKVIMCLNKIPNNYKEEIESLLSRAWVYEVNFDYPTMIKIFYELAKVLKIDFEVVNYIRENSCEATTLDFRTLIKSSIVYNYYTQNPDIQNGQAWKDIVRDLLEKNTDSLLAFVLELMHSRKSVKEQVQEFIERSGYSRRTYFRIKNKLIEKMGSVKVPNPY